MTCTPGQPPGSSRPGAGLGPPDLAHGHPWARPSLMGPSWGTSPGRRCFFAWAMFRNIRLPWQTGHLWAEAKVPNTPKPGRRSRGPRTRSAPDATRLPPRNGLFRTRIPNSNARAGQAGTEGRDELPRHGLPDHVLLTQTRFWRFNHKELLSVIQCHKETYSSTFFFPRNAQPSYPVFHLSVCHKDVGKGAFSFL